MFKISTAILLLFILLVPLSTEAFAQSKITLGYDHDVGCPFSNLKNWPKARPSESNFGVGYIQLPCAENPKGDCNRLIFYCERSCHKLGEKNIFFEYGCRINYEDVKINQPYVVYNATIKINKILGKVPDNENVNPPPGADVFIEYTAFGEIISNEMTELINRKRIHGFAISEAAWLIDHFRTDGMIIQFQGVKGDPKQPDTMTACFKSNFLEDSHVLSEARELAKSQGKQLPPIFRPNLELRINDILKCSSDELIYENQGSFVKIPYQKQYRLTHIQAADEATKMPAWIVLEPIVPPGFEFRD